MQMQMQLCSAFNPGNKAAFWVTKNLVKLHQDNLCDLYKWQTAKHDIVNTSHIPVTLGDELQAIASFALHIHRGVFFMSFFLVSKLHYKIPDILIPQSQRSCQWPFLIFCFAPPSNTPKVNAARRFFTLWF